MLKNMFSSNFSWVFSWSFIVHVFGFFPRFFLRFSDEKTVENGPIFDDFSENPKENSEQNEGEKLNCDKFDENENLKLESEVKSICNGSNTSKYQFITGNSVCAFIEEPQTMNFTVKEMFVISHEDSLLREDPIQSDHHSSEFSRFSFDFHGNSFSDDLGIDLNSPMVDFSGVHVDLGDNDCDELSDEEVTKEGETESSVLYLCYEEQEEIVDQKDNKVEKIELCDEINSSVSNSDDFWASIYKYDDAFSLYDQTSGEALEPETIMVDYDQINAELDDVIKEDELSDIEENEMDEKRLETGELKDLNESKIRELEDEDEDDRRMGSEDVVMEQKELIRQMKKEMRQLKINGLPTILEESESPRVEEDLRPLKIDERIRHKDRMDVIQTFYRRYLDKMRKLDILSQQTMYAIGLLQLKNQDLTSNKKLSVPVIKSLLAQNFWSNKHRKHETDPIQKLIKDLQRDLELAYVGQLCLSWEMLKWEHNKAQELQAHDPDGFRQHNQVAGDFQKFQVLLQRFTEDEPFHQGPRVQHYVKTRCSVPALLQVPLIKDDPQSQWRRNGDEGISVKMLKEVISSSMRSFWEFLRADKDEVCAIPLMGIHGVQPGILQDPSDADLLAEIRSSLLKKEKRLKDLVKSGNCLVRKFQKNQDQKLSQEMLVAQVELRLVSRVLSMPRVTTDQLLWCHKKLNKIDIIGRKIYLEYSFLLFPC